MTFCHSSHFFVLYISSGLPPLFRAFHATILGVWHKCSDTFLTLFRGFHYGIQQLILQVDLNLLQSYHFFRFIPTIVI